MNLGGNKITDGTKEVIEVILKVDDVEETEEEYVCSKCNWRGTFEEAILLEQRELGCPNCGSEVCEI